MNKIASQSQTERNELFAESASRRQVLPGIIEKDFWVCWTLDKLFKIPEISPHLIFKGGTSLSKVYKVIERFSEDIDISIHRGYFGFTGDSDPLNIEGTNKRNKAVATLKTACSDAVQRTILDLVGTSFTNDLGSTGWELAVDENDPDRQTLLFTFPQDRTTTSGPLSRYLRPIIRIEFGARAEHYPAERHIVSPYSAEDFPELFERSEVELKVLASERTFWEKATILHDQYHRDEADKTAERVSRHYYDVHKLNSTEIVARAMADIDLLRSVVANKKIFFTRAGARYDEVLEGQLHLLPSEVRIPALRKDYERMSEMFFEDPPNLDVILDDLQHLEDRINSHITAK